MLISWFCWWHCGYVGSFPTEISWYPYRNQSIINLWVYFLTLDSTLGSIPLTSMYLDSGRFVVNLEIGSCESSKFILLFKNCLIYFESLAFINFCNVSWDLESQSVQSFSPVWLFATPWTAAHQASLSCHQLPEFTQTHVHWLGDAIQPSHPLLFPSPVVLNLSQRQGLFQWVGS